jgi:cytidine deaminase
MDREFFESGRKAYAPYSGFLVGDALRTEAGSVRVGCNVENAAYPQTRCAEAAAVAAMIAASSGALDHRIATDCMVAKAIDGRLATPCGGCRQRIADFASPGAEIHVADPDGRARTFRLGERRPEAFGLEWRT